MRAYGLVVFMLVLIAVTGTTFASDRFMCYECVDCRVDVEYLPRKSNCRVCGKTTIVQDSNTVRTSRYCLDACETVDQVVNGYGNRQNCCYSDLCNGASSLKLAIAGLLFTSVTAFLF